MLNKFNFTSNAITFYVLWYHRYLSSVFDLINIGSFSSCYPYTISNENSNIVSGRPQAIFIHNIITFCSSMRGKYHCRPQTMCKQNANGRHICPECRAQTNIRY